MNLRDQLVKAGFEDRSKSVVCPYCEEEAELVTGRVIYPHRPDLYGKTFWFCRDCKAWVGTHKGSDNKPLGTLANADLREARSAAHSVFDPMWGPGKMSRTEAYSWLAEQLKIKVQVCHIGCFDKPTCMKVISCCEAISLQE